MREIVGRCAPVKIIKKNHYVYFILLLDYFLNDPLQNKEILMSLSRCPKQGIPSNGPNVNGIHIINNTKRIEKEQIENEYSSWEKNLLHVDMFCFIFFLSGNDFFCM